MFSPLSAATDSGVIVRGVVRRSGCEVERESGVGTVISTSRSMVDRERGSSVVGGSWSLDLGHWILVIGPWLPRPYQRPTTNDQHPLFSHSPGSTPESGSGDNGCLTLPPIATMRSMARRARFAVSAGTVI